MIIDYEKLEEILPSELENINKEDFNYLSNLFYFPYYKKYYKNFNGEIKHVKLYHVLSNYLVNELLGRIISEYFGDDKFDIKFVREYNTGVFYLMSDNFIKEGFRYCNMNDEKFSNLNLDKFDNSVSLIERIDNLEFNKESLKNLKSDIKRMLVSDFVIKVQDRAFRNFMLGYNNDKIKLMPLYDFEFSFLESDEDYKNVFAFKFLDFDELVYIRNDKDFQKYLYKAMDLDMKKVFEKFHDIYPIRLDNDEVLKYINFIKDKQNEIVSRRLIK